MAQGETADSWDGDSASVTTSIPHEFFLREAERNIGCTLPQNGEYGVGNVFFKMDDPVQLQTYQSIFDTIANGLGLHVSGWRAVPTNRSILGPAASSQEPYMYQPFVVLHAHLATKIPVKAAHLMPNTSGVS